MKKFLIQIIVSFLILSLCGCSAERIASAIDEDLGTDTKSLGSNIDDKTKEIADKYDAGLSEEDTTDLAKEITGYLIDKAAEFAKNATEKKIDETKESISGNLSGLEKMELISVTDGDTIVALGEDGYEYRIRLIGIDTPESVNVDESKNNDYGVMASAFTKELLKDVSTVYVETDAELYDKYNRLLAYVWLRDDTSDINNMVNAIIAREGYCRQMTIEPNSRYASELGKLIDSAKENKTGLWQYSGYHEIAGSNR